MPNRTPHVRTLRAAYHRRYTSRRMGMLDGKVAIVTGIGSGMGRSIALRFAAEGARLVLGARREAYLQEVAAEVREAGADVLVVPVDLASDDQCNELVDRTLEHFGGVDIFVQNGHDTGEFDLVMDADLARWRQVMEVNFFGALRISQRVVPSMIERGGGRIVLVNSGAALSSPPRHGAYAASKAALSSLARTMANELGHSGVLVNSLTLGPVQGENTTRAIAPPGTTDDERERLVDEKGQALPLGHMPTPDECAGAVLFLVSPLADAITGQAVVVNGGQWVTV
jgi:NAD(P)-dependent dehydrogenase (short-subunit alcohol dehydrogenase family)